MATMSVAAFCISKGCTPAELKGAKYRMLKTLKGEQYPALVVECSALPGDKKALFLSASKKYAGQFKTCEDLQKWCDAHAGADLRVAYGFDTANYTDSYNLCLKGDDNAITANITNW